MAVRIPLLLVFIVSIFCSSESPAQSMVQDELINLPVFIVRSGEISRYDIGGHPPFSESEKIFTYTSLSPLPSGFEFSENGALAWFPTPGEYERLEKEPIELLFVASETATGVSVRGVLKVATRGASASRPSETTVTAGNRTGDSLKMILPNFKGWNDKKEGEAFSFKINATGGTGKYSFSMHAEEKFNFTFEDNGYFYWEPGYDFVTGDNTLRGVRVKFRVKDSGGRKDSATVSLTVQNVNRAPVVNELPTFYVQYDRENVFQLKLDGIIYDQDKDEIVFKPVLSEMPQGMTISRDGELRWKPSVRQFNALRREPLKLRFMVEDIPFGAQTAGIVRLEVTQQDLPPQITMAPDVQHIEIRENETVNFAFFVSDPNGDENIRMFDFVSESQEVEKSALQAGENMQYEFKWTPDYSFVQQTGGNEEFAVTFFAFDRENNRSEKRVRIKVNDAENIEEMDRLVYFQYRTVLATAFELVEQLSEKEEELKREYKTAKNGKKRRAIANASLGAITGLTPFVIEGQPQKLTVGIGGTATATMGTLEASNVIGKPPTDIMQRWTYVTSKKNEILLHGNIFAGKYAQKEERRKSSFQNDLKNLTLQMNLQDMTRLELDASWQNPKDATDKNIKRIFKDFYPDEQYGER